MQARAHAEVETGILAAQAGGESRARQKVRAELEELGWAVIEVWECQTKSGQLGQLADEVRDIVRARLAKGKDR